MNIFGKKINCKECTMILNQHDIIWPIIMCDFSRRSMRHRPVCPKEHAKTHDNAFDVACSECVKLETDASELFNDLQSYILNTLLAHTLEQHEQGYYDSIHGSAVKLINKNNEKSYNQLVSRWSNIRPKFL